MGITSESLCDAQAFVPAVMQRAKARGSRQRAQPQKARKALLPLQCVKALLTTAAGGCFTIAAAVIHHC
jgi:hypothetical protein